MFHDFSRPASARKARWAAIACDHLSLRSDRSNINHLVDGGCGLIPIMWTDR
jgi:hypothetical protein